MPLLLGHRGARHYSPENTLAAFDLALAHGCDGFEFDVRLSADHHPIIAHDPNLHDVMIADFTAEKLFAIQNTIPEMWQVFERYAATAYLNIELKVVGLEHRLIELLETYPPKKGYMVSSFLPEAIRSMHATGPQVPLGYICRRKDLLVHWRSLPVSHVILHHALVTAALIGELRGMGKQVFVWTVNKREHIEAMAALGVDGIISDDTKLLCDILPRHRGMAAPIP
ncbi:MAG TPA: glycerophosphodiester phosphodiesterase [Terriglobales bacterium]|nr:glycerophosphodiester phosphodiesterase [Terriglobales bacterium]